MYKNLLEQLILEGLEEHKEVKKRTAEQNF